MKKKKLLSNLILVTLLFFSRGSLANENDAITEAKGAILRYCIEKYDSPINYKANWLKRKYEDWRVKSRVSKCMDAQAEALNNIDWNSPYTESCIIANITPKGNWNHVGIWECLEAKNLDK